MELRKFFNKRVFIKEAKNEFNKEFNSQINASTLQQETSLDKKNFEIEFIINLVNQNWIWAGFSFFLVWMISESDFVHWKV